MNFGTGLIGVTAAALAALALAAPASAQTWRMQDRVGDETFALAQWASGVLMFARCDSGDFDLSARLAARVHGSEVSVSYAFDGGDETTESWPVVMVSEMPSVQASEAFTRGLLSARSIAYTVSDGRGPNQRYELQAPAEPRVLRRIMADCGI